MTKKSLILHSSSRAPGVPDSHGAQLLRDRRLASAEALDNVVKGDRAFFDNTGGVEDYIHKVHFYEHEADTLEEQAKKAIFVSEEIPDLAEKLQLRAFVELIASLSDEAEDVADRLSVYAIKRQP
jgi:hypothetical protein